MFLGKSRVAVSASSCHGWELNSAPRSAEGVERCGGWGWGESGRKLVLARQPDWGWHEPPPPRWMGAMTSVLFGGISHLLVSHLQKNPGTPLGGEIGEGNLKTEICLIETRLGGGKTENFYDSIDPNQKHKLYNRNWSILNWLAIGFSIISGKENKYRNELGLNQGYLAP